MISRDNAKSKFESVNFEQIEIKLQPYIIFQIDRNIWVYFLGDQLKNLNLSI